MHKRFDNTQQWLDFDRDHLWHPYTSMDSPLPCYPVVATQGAYVELANGQQLLDGMSSWWSAIHGYNNPRIAQAVAEQLKIMPHFMFGGAAHSGCLLYTSPSPRDKRQSRMPSSA